MEGSWHGGAVAGVPAVGVEEEEEGEEEAAENVVQE